MTDTPLTVTKPAFQSFKVVFEYMYAGKTASTLGKKNMNHPTTISFHFLSLVVSVLFMGASLP